MFIKDFELNMDNLDHKDQLSALRVDPDTLFLFIFAAVIFIALAILFLGISPPFYRPTFRDEEAPLLVERHEDE